MFIFVALRSASWASLGVTSPREHGVADRGPLAPLGQAEQWAATPRHRRQRHSPAWVRAPASERKAAGHRNRAAIDETHHNLTQITNLIPDWLQPLGQQSTIPA